MIVITGANGQLGRLVIAALLARNVAPQAIVAAVRSPEKAADLAAQGVQVRRGDYDDPASLDAAFAGAQKVLLISSSEVGRRVAQHRAAIDAAARAQVPLLAYTSLLHADVSVMALAEEHRATETLLKASGVPHVLLRNGWYNENHVHGVPQALQFGVVLGCAGDGRIASAARADYAEAAAAVLTSPEPQAGRVYELAGDGAYTLAALAAEIARLSGQPVVYRDLPQADFAAALQQAGVPGPFAQILADSDAAAANGALFDAGRQLSGLIGRPTTPWAETVAAALR